MALNDAALFTAAKGYIYIAASGTAAPTPSAVDTFNAATFGSEVQTITVTGTPTGGTFTLTYATQTTAAIPYNATAAQVQTALENLSNIAVGDVVCGGGPLPGSAVTVTFEGLLGSSDIALVTATGSITGGTSPAAAITTSTAPSGWSLLGHTSRDKLPAFSSDGGDTETKGTWQNAAVKQVITKAVVDSVTFELHQFDEAALALYYGQANASATVGEFSVADAPTAGTERALFIVMLDGDATIGFHARKASILRADSVAMAVDAFSTLPLKATFLKDGTNNLFSWISLDIPVNPA